MGAIARASGVLGPRTRGNRLGAFQSLVNRGGISSLFGGGAAFTIASLLGRRNNTSNKTAVGSARVMPGRVESEKVFGHKFTNKTNNPISEVSGKTIDSIRMSPRISVDQPSDYVPGAVEQLSSESHTRPTAANIDFASGGIATFDRPENNMIRRVQGGFSSFADGKGIVNQVQRGRLIGAEDMRQSGNFDYRSSPYSNIPPPAPENQINTNMAFGNLFGGLIK
jgi:hypothetical protein